MVHLKVTVKQCSVSGEKRSLLDVPRQLYCWSHSAFLEMWCPDVFLQGQCTSSFSYLFSLRLSFVHLMLKRHLVQRQMSKHIQTLHQPFHTCSKPPPLHVSVNISPLLPPPGPCVPSPAGAASPVERSGQDLMQTAVSITETLDLLQEGARAVAAKGGKNDRR